MVVTSLLRSGIEEDHNNPHEPTSGIFSVLDFFFQIAIKCTVLTVTSTPDHKISQKHAKIEFKIFQILRIFSCFTKNSENKFPFSDTRLCNFDGLN